MRTDLMEAWEQDVHDRYDPKKKQDEFRDYDSAPARVREFYQLNHTHQTRDFVLAKKREYGALGIRKLGMWEALVHLNTLVDESDPDTDLSQVAHALQSAEAARRDGREDWFQLTCLIHDLGKVLCLWGEEQWAVVGDTFPVGCAWSGKIVLNGYFRDNPDSANVQYQTKNGVYSEGCGLDKVDLSWGHDEYLYMVTKPYLPIEAQYMIRYHSFYPWHREGAYEHFMNEQDRRMLPWVKEFNPYDLYSKSDEKPDEEKLTPYYKELIARYFPAEFAW